MLHHIFVTGWFFYINVRVLAQRDAKEDVCRWPEQVSRQRIGALARDSSASTATTATSLSLNSRRSFTPRGEGGILPTQRRSTRACSGRYRASASAKCSFQVHSILRPLGRGKLFFIGHASKRWSSEALGWFGSRGHFAKVAARSRTTITPTWSKIAPILNLRREVYRSYDSSFLSVKRFASLSIRA
jgi:hypothetical protein